MFPILCFGQYNIPETILKRKIKPIFHIISGSFESTKSTYAIVNGEKRKQNTEFKFSNSKINLSFSYPKTSSDSSCNYFILFGNKISLHNKFEQNFTCDLDINSFQVYVSEFNNRKYLLLNGINAGSGDFATTIIFLLFDITDKLKIKFYPLWSKYGSINCLDDFNRDGKLDFLKIRNNETKTGSNTFKVSFMSVDNVRFQFEDSLIKTWIIKRSYNQNNEIKFKVLKEIL